MTFVTKLQITLVKFPTIAPEIRQNGQNYSDFGQHSGHTTITGLNDRMIYKLNTSENLALNDCRRQMSETHQ